MFCTKALYMLVLTLVIIYASFNFGNSVKVITN